jgi:catalase
MAEKKKVYTTGFGGPIDNDQNSKTAGNPGPIPVFSERITLSCLRRQDRRVSFCTSARTSLIVGSVVAILS